MHFPSTQDCAAAISVVGGIVAILRADFILRWLRSHRAMVNIVKSLEDRHVKDSALIEDLQRTNEAGLTSVGINEGLLHSLNAKVDQLSGDLAIAQRDLAEMTVTLTAMTTKFAEGIAYISLLVAMHEPGTALPELPLSIKPDVLAELEKRRSTT
jgi:hypothetical protein